MGNEWDELTPWEQEELLDLAWTAVSHSDPDHQYEPCVHGHYDCAVYRRGPCRDEEASRLLDKQRLTTTPVEALRMARER
jgi:hypothetical protein